MALRALTDVSDVDSFVGQAVHDMAALVGARRCSIVLVVDGHLRSAAAVGLSEEFCTLVDGLAARLDREPRIVADLHADPRWQPFREIIQAEGVRSCVAVPLVRRDGSVLGVFTVYGDQPGVPDAALVEDARRVAALATLGLERRPLDDLRAAVRRLGGELEFLDAVRSVVRVPAGDVVTTVRAVASSAAEALSCAFAAVVLEDGTGPVAWANRGWRPGGDALDAGLHALATRVDDEPLQLTDPAAARAVLADLGDPAGATAVYAMPLGRPRLGTLVLVRAEPDERGFDALWHRIADGVADAGELVLRRALDQERLARENAKLSRMVHVDALTGAASRAAWERLAADHERHRADFPDPVSVAVFDADDLKTVNDRDGHQAGDRLLRTCARVLLRCSRESDLVARVGGDEFAVLLRGCHEADAAAWCARVSRNLARRGTTMSCGWAEIARDGSLADAFADADARLLLAKASARTRP
jgi:diguanylate cyclase (GGDEF)-like protein